MNSRDLLLNQLAHLVLWKLCECTFLVSHWFWEQSQTFPKNVLRMEVNIPPVLDCRDVLRTEVNIPPVLDYRDVLRTEVNIPPVLDCRDVLRTFYYGSQNVFMVCFINL
jgi:hypothetical protein